MTQNFTDEDTEALKEFKQVQESYQINYASIKDDDVLIDAMSEAKTIDLKKLLMRYRRLKNEANLRDPAFVARLSRNYFSCVRKSGVLKKRGETSWFGSWEERYVILTNAGMLYFEGKMIQSKGDLKP